MMFPSPTSATAPRKCVVLDFATKITLLIGSAFSYADAIVDGDGLALAVVPYLIQMGQDNP